MFLETYSTKFDKIMITFADQIRRLEIKVKVNLKLLINKQKCSDILLNQEQEDMLEHVLENVKKKKFDTRLDASKNVTHKAGDFLGNKIADAVTMSNDDRIQKQEPAEEIIIPLEKREEILGKLRNML